MRNQPGRSSGEGQGIFRICVYYWRSGSANALWIRHDTRPYEVRRRSIRAEVLFSCGRIEGSRLPSRWLSEQDEVLTGAGRRVVEDVERARQGIPYVSRGVESGAEVRSGDAAVSND